ncbi:hypothetical protein DV738_g582, partial [Chaetothyriales sp. CBS 135597]
MGGKHRPKPKKSPNSKAVHNLHPSTPSSVMSRVSGTPSHLNSFSMAQEARNTESHTNGWANARLRGNAVAFVSAGHLVQEELQSSGQEDQVQEAEKKPVAVSGVRTDEYPPTDTPPTSIDAPEQVPEPKKDTNLDSDSDSAAEKILFRGRSKQTSDASSSPKPSLLSTRSTSHQPPSLPSSRKVSQTRAPAPKKSRLKQMLFVSDEEEAIIQDYIANMSVQDDEGDEETFRFYKAAGHENVKVQTKSKLNMASVSSYQADKPADWDSSALSDFDQLSTTDEEIEEIDQVLRHRDRPNGAQYLVTAGAKGGDYAKWIQHSKLTSSTATAKIQAYHESLKTTVETEEDVFDSSSDGDEDALEDIIDDIESEDAENAEIIARTNRMTDEQIARALAKQEELGIGADQLVLFDGQEGEYDEDANFRFNHSSHFATSASPPGSGRSRAKKNRRQQNNFPSAAAFADVLDEDPYTGFDVMDFDRPSVRPKRKGKKNDFAFDFGLSDDELATHIKSQWQKDRDRKAARKREKMEELEALLIEAEERSHPAAIRAEIRRFLIEETDTLKLAPMPSHTRAGVHRLAKSLKLNSRSVGKETRYPVLTKTPHTPSYTIDTIWQVDALMQSRKFFPTQHGGFSRGARASAGKRGGGVADATFRTGDIVGGSAPELGADNKGRAMLEKMGWTSGTGIGADGNKGRLLHIEQVVKRGRSGLG